ncbi:unnamed protein product, partial [Durusdinium trenchii]
VSKEKKRRKEAKRKAKKWQKLFNEQEVEAKRLAALVKERESEILRLRASAFGLEQVRKVCMGAPGEPLALLRAQLPLVQPPLAQPPLTQVAAPLVEDEGASGDDRRGREQRRERRRKRRRGGEWGEAPLPGEPTRRGNQREEEQRARPSILKQFFAKHSSWVYSKEAQQEQRGRGRGERGKRDAKTEPWRLPYLDTVVVPSENARATGAEHDYFLIGARKLLDDTTGCEAASVICMTATRIFLRTVKTHAGLGNTSADAVMDTQVAIATRLSKDLVNIPHRRPTPEEMEQHTLLWILFPRMRPLGVACAHKKMALICAKLTQELAFVVEMGVKGRRWFGASEESLESGLVDLCTTTTSDL